MTERKPATVASAGTPGRWAAVGRWASRRRPGAWIFVAINLLVAYAVLQLRFHESFQSQMAFYRALVDLEGPLPFQARVLIPALVHGIESMLAEKVSLLWLAKLVDYLALVAAVFGFKRYLSAWISPSSSAFASLSLYAVLPFHHLLPTPVPLLYPYDLPALAFIVWGMVLLQEGKWKCFYPVFVLACLNRETACLLTLGHTSVCLNRRDLPRWMPHLAGQLFIWCVCWVGLRYFFRSNPGELFEIHLQENKRSLQDQTVYFQLAGCFGYLWALVFLTWKWIPSSLKKQLMTLPFLFTLMMYVGNIGELRVYGELIPYVLAAAWVGLVYLLQDRDRLRGQLAGALQAPTFGVSKVNQQLKVPR